MICFYCEKYINRDEGERMRIVAIDRPVYVNLTFHANGCLEQVDSYGRDKYLNENKERVYKAAQKSSISSEKKTKRK